MSRFVVKTTIYYPAVYTPFGNPEHKPHPKNPYFSVTVPWADLDPELRKFAEPRYPRDDFPVKPELVGVAATNFTSSFAPIVQFKNRTVPELISQMNQLRDGCAYTNIKLDSLFDGVEADVSLETYEIKHAEYGEKTRLGLRGISVDPGALVHNFVTQFLIFGGP